MIDPKPLRGLLVAWCIAALMWSLVAWAIFG